MGEVDRWESRREKCERGSSRGKASRASTSTISTWTTKKGREGYADVGKRKKSDGWEGKCVNGLLRGVDRQFSWLPTSNDSKKQLANATQRDVMRCVVWTVRRKPKARISKILEQCNVFLAVFRFPLPQRLQVVSRDAIVHPRRAARLILSFFLFHSFIALRIPHRTKDLVGLIKSLVRYKRTREICWNLPAFYSN